MAFWRGKSTKQRTISVFSVLLILQSSIRAVATALPTRWHPDTWAGIAVSCSTKVIMPGCPEKCKCMSGCVLTIKADRSYRFSILAHSSSEPYQHFRIQRRSRKISILMRRIISKSTMNAGMSAWTTRLQLPRNLRRNTNPGVLLTKINGAVACKQPTHKNKIKKEVAPFSFMSVKPRR